MSTLSNQQQNQSFEGLLQIPGGVTAQLQPVQDGNGNNTGLWLSSTNTNILPYDAEEQVIIATAGQTVFNLSITYTPATNSLQVFIDGLNQVVNQSYIETDSNTVTFVTGLNVGAVVKFSTAAMVSTNAVAASSVSFTGANGVHGNVQDLADPTGAAFVGFTGANGTEGNVQDLADPTGAAFVGFTGANAVVGNVQDLADPTGAAFVGFTGANAVVGNVQDLADPTGSDLVGFKQAGTGAVNRTALGKMRESVSVLDFGAVCDGVTDDRAEIQAAINYCLTNNIKQLDGKGAVCAISSSLTFTSVDDFELCNFNFVAISGTWSSSTYMVVFSDTTANYYDFNRCTISNVYLNCKNLCSGFYIQKPQSVLITGSKIIHYHPNGNGFLQAGASADLRIDNCYIGGHYFGSPDNGGGGTTAYYNGVAVYFEGPDNKITNSTLVGDNVPLTYTRYISGTYPRTVVTDTNSISIDACHSYNGLMLMDGYYHNITNSYFGWNSIRMLYPYSIVIANNKFIRENLASYVDANDWMIALEPPAPGPVFYLANVVIEGNAFLNSYPTGNIRPIQRWGTVTIPVVQECVINNSYSGNCLVTKLQQTLKYTGAGPVLNYTFDFSNQIIFGQIWGYQCSYKVTSGGPPANICVSGTPSINSVTVSFDILVSNAEIVCTIDVNQPY